VGRLMAEPREHDAEAQADFFREAGLRDLPAHVSPTIRGERRPETTDEKEERDE
jgi:hypothetical protein